MTATVPVAVVTHVVAAALVIFAPREPTRFSVATSFAVVVALVLLGFIALTRDRLPRAGVGAAVGATTWTATIGWFVLDRLQTPLVYAESGMRCGTGMMGLLVIVVPFVLVVAFAVNMALVFATTSRTFDRLVRGAALIATALATISLGFSAPRWQLPDPDTYLASLPDGIIAKPGANLRIAGHEIQYVATKVPSEHLGGVACRLEGNGRSHVVDHHIVPGECPTMKLRVDPRGDYAFVFASTPDSSLPTWTPRLALRTSDLEAVDFRASLVADRLAAPLAWRDGALAPTTLALLLLFVGHCVRRFAAARPGRAAHHRGDGLCHLADAPDALPVRVAAAGSLPVGPVVLYGPARPKSAYRDGAGPTFTDARAGAPTRETDLAASLEAVALAAALLGATPLFVARLFGL